MRIGSIALPNRTLLAPLAGITNLPFRLLARENGCGLVYSEMISSNGLIYRTHKTYQMLATVPAEKPLTVQIFGGDPRIMAEAARIVADHGADIVDINMGCSVKKVVKTGAGVALMRTPDLTRKIIIAVRKALQIPLTLKLRLGWDASGQQAQSIAIMAQEEGVDAVALHPRTASQAFKGTADWSKIGVLKHAIRIPVIGNGDILDARDAVSMIRQTGCDGVMVGRAVMRDPMIFTKINALLEGNEALSFNIAEHFNMMIKYLEDSVHYIGEIHGCHMMRSRLAWFVKGLPHNAGFREAIKNITTIEEARRAIHAYRQRIESLKEVPDPPPPSLENLPLEPTEK